MQILVNGQPLPSVAEARRFLWNCCCESMVEFEEVTAIFNRALEGGEEEIDDIFRISGYTMEIIHDA